MRHLVAYSNLLDSLDGCTPNRVHSNLSHKSCDLTDPDQLQKCRLNYLILDLTDDRLIECESVLREWK